MQISADHIFVEDAFAGVLSVVAVAAENCAERSVASDIGPAAVVLKAHDLIGQFLGERLISEDDVGNQARRAVFRVEVQKRKPLHLSIRRVVIVAEKLVAAADRENRTAVFHIVVKFLLHFLQPGTDDLLLPVGTAAEQDDVCSGEGYAVVKIVFRNMCIDPAPFAAHAETLDIAPVAVEIQKVREEVDNVQFSRACTRGSGTGENGCIGESGYICGPGAHFLPFFLGMGARWSFHLRGQMALPSAKGVNPSQRSNAPVAGWSLF